MTPMAVRHQTGAVVPRAPLVTPIDPADVDVTAGTTDATDGTPIVAFALADSITAAGFEAVTAAGLALVVADGTNATSTQKFIPEPL
jgi:hypothetical protein